MKLHVSITQWGSRDRHPATFHDARARASDPLLHPGNDVSEQDTLVRRIIVVVLVVIAIALTTYAFSSGGLSTMLIAGGLIALAVYLLWRWWR